MFGWFRRLGLRREREWWMEGRTGLYKWRGSPPSSSVNGAAEGLWADLELYFIF